MQSHCRRESAKCSHVGFHTQAIQASIFILRMCFLTSPKACPPQNLNGAGAESNQSPRLRTIVSTPPISVCASPASQEFVNIEFVLVDVDEAEDFSAPEATRNLKCLKLKPFARMLSPQTVVVENSGLRRFTSALCDNKGIRFQ